MNNLEGKSLVDKSERVCKNCYKTEKEHLDSGLAKNWDCPVWTGGDGGRHFELLVDKQETEKSIQSKTYDNNLMARGLKLLNDEMERLQDENNGNYI